MLDSLIDMKSIVVATCLAIVTLALGATPVSAGKAQHKQPAKCGTGHGRVIAADTQAQLYIASNIEEYFIVYGCVYGHRGSYKLGYFPSDGTCSSSGCLDIHRETLAGMIVAYEYSASNVEEFTWLVVVRDLRTGRVLHKIPTGTPVPPNPLLVGTGSTVVIVVKTDGSVAWIVEYPVGPETTKYEVHALDKTGNRVLASGTDIGPHSLALAGSTLYWTQGGKSFSTKLN